MLTCLYRSTNTNCVLADEMGLGKTAQTVSFIAALETAGWRPALVVAPLSTLTHWQRELTEWTPHLNAVIFTGTPEGRDIIRQVDIIHVCPIAWRCGHPLRV